MADERATPTSPNGDRRKGKKPIPTWYYAVGAGLLAVGYYVYSKRQAATAAASTASSTSANGGLAAGDASSAGTAASSYGNAGDLAALEPYLANLQGQQATTTGTAAPTTTAYTPPAGVAQSGSGYNTGTNTNGIVATDGHTYEYLSTPQQYSALQSSGGSGYYQVLPGVFYPITASTQLASGTPVFAQVG